MALDPRSRASWATLTEEGWYLQQRERFDDETPLMTLGRLRDTRGHWDAVFAATAGPTAAVNAVLRSLELDENDLRLWSGISSLADPGGSERRELIDGRLAKSGQDQHTSDALVERGSCDPSVQTVKNSELPYGSRTQRRLDRRCERYLWSTTRLGCKPCTE